MLFKRSKSSSFGPNGRRVDGGGTTTTFGSGLGSTTSTTTTTTTTSSCGGGGIVSNRRCHSSNALFTGGSSTCTGLKLGSGGSSSIQRAPIMSGLNVVIPGVSNSVLAKKFQRPMMKRRAYQKGADEALQQASLGQKKRINGMANILGRAGRPLTFMPLGSGNKENRKGSDDESGSDDDDEDKEPDRPFEPLMLWKSPHDGGISKGLPPRQVTEQHTDEFGIEETVTRLRPAPLERYSRHNVFCPPVLAKWLRPHQREGVQFMYDCVMGLKDYVGQGCILADDMGLGKTLQSVTLIYTLLKTGIVSSKTGGGFEPTCKRVIVVCPCSLVKNWDNEFVKWLGPGVVKTLPLAEADRKTIEKNLDCFIKTKLFDVLICSYECLRSHVGRLLKNKECCDLLVCDEAHRLKNNDNQTSRALDSLPVKRRVLLTGTPMQNDLTEFFAMVDFTNPGILGTQEEFRRRMLMPILRGREPDATDAQRRKMLEIQNDMSTTVNDFILRRVNTLNAQHLPPKLVQVVCCNLTAIQQNMYQHLVNSKATQHVLDGKQVNCLGSIQLLMKLCNHPTLAVDEDPVTASKAGGGGGASGGRGRRASAKTVKYNELDDPQASAPAVTPGAEGIAKFLPYIPQGGGGRGGGSSQPIHPEWSGKMFVLYRLMKEMRRPGNGNDKIVIISNYTQTLDLIGRMCRQNSWGFCRLDGSITMKKRQKMVDEFNEPASSLVAFLLSSKAGGCGLNLIGGNRLVLFDPDWNPAVDKQAAARCWRDGQKKRCFTYRFLATGTVEEKIFQRQLSKEGLQSVVDDKEQVNALSTKDLKNLFKLRAGTPSDTHDKLRCERCKIIQDDAELKAAAVLPQKLEACRELVDQMMNHEDSAPFHKPLIPDEHGVTKEVYEKAVKQPMDLGTIQNRLKLALDQPSAYKSAAGMSKDVNRIFSNVMKVWEPDHALAETARKLQLWWIEQWTELVPRLMSMTADTSKQSCGGEEPEDAASGSIDACGKLGLLHQNERGDDYQEQIGMPDEENMRSWSHHHTTDTVDDPIFRAAMRGCDAVSFVFGLEVTWSLIQQRQQDEEERLALQELEAIQEMDEDDKGEEAAGDNEDAAEGETNEAGDETSQPRPANEDDETDETPASPNPNDNHEDNEEVLEDTEDEDEEEEDQLLEDLKDEDENDEMMVDQDGSDDEGSANLAESDPNENDDNEVDGGDDHDDEEDSSMSQDNDPAVDSSVPPQSPPTEAAGIHSADMIEGSGDTTETSPCTSSQSTASSSTPHPGPSPNEWPCPTCTLYNRKSLRKCGACGARKPKQGKKRSIDHVL